MITVPDAENPPRSDVGSQLRALCEWAAARTWDDLPPRVRTRARWVLADDLAAMIAAGDEPEVDAYRRLVAGRPSVREASIVGPGLPKTDRWQAASVNAIAASWCELDEGFRPVTCHAGLYTIPALLAEAESAGLRLSDVLRCIALSYECVTRMAACFRFPAPTVHAHALWSAVGAAAAVALSRRYDGPTLAGAMTAAATLSSIGPRPHLVEGVLVRNAWAAGGAVAGMQCADWALCGIAGSDSSPSAVYRDILHADEQAESLAVSLGEAWAIERGYHKLYACCQHGHSAVEAILAQLAKAPLNVDDVDSIEAYTHPLALGLNNAAPATSLGAKFSMPHIIAASLVHGSAGPASFSSGALRDPGIARLRERVRLKPYDGALTPPFDRPARLSIALRSGERIVAECRSARGGPDRPLTDGELLDKVSQLASPVLPGLSTLVGGSHDRDAGTAWSSLLARMQTAPAD